MKIRLLAFITVLCALCLTACAQSPVQETASVQSEQSSQTEKSASSQSVQLSEDDAKKVLEQVVPRANKLAVKLFTGGFEHDYDTGSEGYYLVKDYDSLQALKDDINQYFSPKMAEKLLARYLNDDDIPFFKEIEGRLYSLDAGAGSFLSWEVDTAKNIAVSADSIKTEMICYRDMEDLTYYPLTLVKLDDRWVIDSSIDPTAEQ